MEDSAESNIVLPAIIISIILFAGVYLAFQSSKSHQGTIVLPGGITYLGPTPTSPAEARAKEGFTVPIPSDSRWAERHGATFPYIFSYPETLSLGTFPDDPYDSLTLFYPGTDANANIFFRVENLTKLNKKQYMGKTEEYAKNWWKEYNWKGVESVIPFTNSKGLKGYRAKYLNDQNNTPYDHVFFEVPASDNLVIWLSGKLFTREVFDRMADSVAWSP